MTQLSPHFTLAEMTRSATAIRLGIDNAPSPPVIAALTLVCQNILEPVRTHFARPVTATSGYRCFRLNAIIGGSTSSQHCKGEAVDFTVPGVSNFDLAQWVMRNLKYDQLIYEFGEQGWVHVSFHPGNLRFEVLSITRRGTTKGLVR